jgi:hypothetical protein
MRRAASSASSGTTGLYAPRVLPDESRGGFPAMIVEVFWITDPVFHLLRVDGFTLDTTADGSDERSIVSHRRISLEQVADYKFDLVGELGGTIELVGGEEVKLTVALLHSYLKGCPGGYGRPGGPFQGDQ